MDQAVPAPVQNRLAQLLGQIVGGAEDMNRGAPLTGGVYSAMSDLMGIPGLQKTLERMTFGEPVTTGRGQTLHLMPETIDAATLAAGPAARGGKTLARGLGEVMRLSAPSADAMTSLHSQIGAVGNVGRSTVANPQRKAFPGVYGDPRDVAAEAAANVAPENPAMKQLFGVTRDDLYEMSKGRKGNEAPAVRLPANPKGSAAAEKVMTPRNERRLLAALEESEKYPQLTKGMDAWYTMDPAFDRLKSLVGLEKAKELYTRFNTLTGMASPGSDVLTELNRGTAANYLNNQGRFDDFLNLGGAALSKRGKNYPEDMRAVLGHPYHSTAHGVPMKKYLEGGVVDMDSPKVPLYIHASGVPETGFQTALPVGDAHWSRAVGLADTRTNKAYGASVTTPELATLGPWWRDNIAAKAGLESVPAQARTWGLFSPQTGVDTPVGAPKLELLSQQIMKAAQRYGVSPEQARDMILTGSGYAGAAGALSPMLGELLKQQGGEPAPQTN